MSSMPEKNVAFLCGSLLESMLQTAAIHPESIPSIAYYIGGPGLEVYGQKNYWENAIKEKRRVVKNINDDPVEFFGRIDMRAALAAIKEGISPAGTEASPYTNLLHTIITTRHRKRYLLAEICCLTLSDTEFLVAFCRNNMSLINAIANHITSDDIFLSSEMLNIIAEKTNFVNKSMEHQRIFMSLQMTRDEIVRLTNGISIAGVCWEYPELPRGRRPSVFDARMWDLVAEFINEQEHSPLSLEDDLTELFVQIARRVADLYANDAEGTKRTGCVLLDVICSIKNFEGKFEKKTRKCTVAPTGYAKNLAGRIFLTIEGIQ